MKVCVLGSGSQGQAVYVSAAGRHLLFDAGFSGREIKRRLAEAGGQVEQLEAVVLSHEHEDHIAALRVLGRHLPVYATRGTLQQVHQKFEIALEEEIVPGQWHELGGLRFRAVSVPHDAVEPVAFVIEDGLSRAAIVTDLGTVTGVVRQALKDVNLLVLETNHDLQMLLDGPYPWEVKQRIKSNYGHLSNRQARDLAGAIVWPGLKKVLLAHLSQTNNRPEKARAEVQKALDGAGCWLGICSQDRPTRMFEI